MTDPMELFDDVSNPLDTVEEIFLGHQWHFNRANDDSLTVHANGNKGDYTMTFLWEENHCAIQFRCEFDIFIPKERLEMANRILRTVNERLWMGHIILPSIGGSPYFRHTMLFNGQTHISGAEHIASLVEIALTECERHHNVLNMLSSSTYLTDSLLDLAVVKSAGKA